MTEKKTVRSTSISKSDAQSKHSGGTQPRKNLPTKVTQKGVLTEGSVKGVSRWHPGMEALWEIYHYQKQAELLIWMLPFQRLVREIAQDYKMDLWFQASAILALQQAAKLTLSDCLMTQTCM